MSYFNCYRYLALHTLALFLYKNQNINTTTHYRSYNTNTRTLSHSLKFNHVYILTFTPYIPNILTQLSYILTIRTFSLMITNFTANNKHRIHIVSLSLSFNHTIITHRVYLATCLRSSNIIAYNNLTTYSTHNILYKFIVLLNPVPYKNV